MANEAREPLFHITKRGPLRWYQAWAVRGGAVLLALVFCGLVTTLVTGENPLSVYGTVFQASFSTTRRRWILLQNIAMLLCASLAVVPAFRMRFWNLGGEGQMLAGGLATAACMICLRDVLPNWAIILCMVVSSLAAGALWGLIPAIFKARFNTNETLFTLMMNYVATQLVAYFIIIWEQPKGAGQIGIINQSTQIGWLPVIGSSKYLLNVIIVGLVCVLMYIYLRYSKHGYEISVVGESERTAKYVGIKVGRVILRTMAFSGALCGLTGMLLVGGTDHTLTTTITGGRGFTAVMVAWLAKFNPIWMIMTSFLLVFLQRGAGEISTVYNLNQSYGDILTGLILFFIVGSEFFISYRISFRRAAKKEGSLRVGFCIHHSPRRDAGHPPAVRQHGRNPDRKERQPEPGHPRHHVRGGHQRGHRRLSV